MRFTASASSLLVASFIGIAAAQAQTAQAVSTTPPVAPAEAPKDTAGSPSSLVILFDSGSSTLRGEDRAVLDHASRAYNEGKPIVMILTGTSDRVGGARMNLALSQRRATAVLAALLDRGIPADRVQVLAKGETELPVPTKQGMSEARNRSVEITWH